MGTRLGGRFFLRRAEFVALLFLTACPKVKVPKKIPGTSGESKLDLKVHVSPKANNNNPVAVDLVLVSDKKLLQELMKMSASEWFEKRHQVATRLSQRDWTRRGTMGMGARSTGQGRSCDSEI